MTADPREQISDFTEMTDEELAKLIGSFFRAIGWGAVAGSGFFLVFTVPFGLATLIADGESGGLLVAVLPLAIAFAGTLAGMIFLGLPLTALLRHLKGERVGFYSAMGIFGGLLLPMAFLALLEGEFNSGSVALGIFLGPFGAMAGGVCANIWGAYRVSLAQNDSDKADSPTNPYHDMIY